VVRRALLAQDRRRNSYHRLLPHHLDRLRPMKNHSEGPEVDDPRGVEASNRYDSIVLFPIGEVEILMAAFGEEEVA
jgi:hypothetical protein